MGLQMTEGVPYKYAVDYSYVEIPLGTIYNPSTEEVLNKASRNQHLLLKPACSLRLDGNHKIIVKTNPLLQEFATVPAVLLLDPKSGEQPHFYASFRKDMDLSDLDWLVRLYMVS